MVIAGPVSAVVASFTSMYLAISGRDPVLDRDVPMVRPAVNLETLTPEQRLAAEKAVLPARQGRNLATSTDLPKPPPP